MSANYWIGTYVLHFQCGLTFICFEKWFCGQIETFPRTGWTWYL